MGGTPKWMVDDENNIDTDDLGGCPIYGKPPYDLSTQASTRGREAAEGGDHGFQMGHAELHWANLEGGVMNHAGFLSHGGIPTSSIGEWFFGFSIIFFSVFPL